MKDSHIIKRKPVVAGSFYSSDPKKLTTELKKYFSGAGSQAITRNIRALISPHAGYVYSGQVAASAFNSLDPLASYKNIFIIGSSHHISFDGASVYSRGNYYTPLGEIKVNRELAKTLISDNSCFDFNMAAHSNEHSLEVQLPFLQFRLSKAFQIVPVVIATNNKERVKDISVALQPYFNKDNLFVISTDLSHYPGYSDAVIADRRMIEAVESGIPDKLSEAAKKNKQSAFTGLMTSMCGWTSVLCLMYLAEKESGLKFKKILYKNSGDVEFGDKDRVVGYVSILLESDKAHA